MSAELPPMRDSLVWLLDLRLKVRGSREATEIVDRCLSIWTRAQDADEATHRKLKAEIDELANDLALRFGAPKAAVLN